MADITEAEQWDTGVYQLETTDPVQGGDDGVDNLPHKALANRTLWLKAQVALKALLGGSATQLFKVKAGVADDEAVNKSQMDSSISYKADKTEVIGISQTWQNVIASRSAGTTYTNTTGKSIQVALRINSDSSENFYVDGVVICSYADTSGTTSHPQIIIPVGSTYSVQAGAVINSWFELR